MEYPKVLLACPTSSHKAYCQKEWIEHVSKLTYPNLEVLIVDNSKDLGNAKELVNLLSETNLKYRVVHREPKEKLVFTLVDCCNYIRSVVLKEKFDYWLSLESDQFPPLNVIEHFISCNKSAICATYFTFGGNSTLLLHYKYENIEGYPFLLQKTGLDTFINDIKEPSLSKTIQAGIGCLLVKSSLLRKVVFRYDPNEYEHGFHDYFFVIDINRLGVDIYTDYSVISEHRNTMKRWVEIFDNQKVF